MNYVIRHPKSGHLCGTWTEKLDFMQHRPRWQLAALKAYVADSLQTIRMANQIARTPKDLETILKTNGT